MAKPPIGFFRNFILDASGERKKALNLKKRGVTPVITMQGRMPLQMVSQV